MESVEAGRSRSPGLNWRRLAELKTMSNACCGPLVDRYSLPCWMERRKRVMPKTPPKLAGMWQRRLTGHVLINCEGFS